jgi:Protein of unknown function (DUF4435)
MRWSPQELVYELRRDYNRRVLFVEGNRDLSFWGILIPPHLRKDGNIYPISSLDCPAATGGERGRIIASATNFITTTVSDRVRFFADADTDRVLNITVPPNVFFTDGRDLESYGLSEACLARIISICFPADSVSAFDLMSSIETAVRPIGILRVVDRRENLLLPFRKTFDRDFGRFLVLDGASGKYSVEIEKLVRILLQNQRGSLRELQNILQMQQDTVAALEDIPSAQLVHGKDLVRFLALQFSVQPDEMERHLFMSAAHDSGQIRRQANISRALQWLTS